MRLLRNFVLLACLALLPCKALPQAGVSLGVPFDFPLLLSGNFAELRSNHFHSGIDFKTFEQNISVSFEAVPFPIATISTPQREIFSLRISAERAS